MIKTLRLRMPHRDDDRGSMALAILAIVVSTLIGTLILPMLITQDHSTRFDISRVHSLDAAETGIDVVLGQIRVATRVDSNGNVWGDASGLPCATTTQPITGSASGTAAGGTQASVGTYSVTINYYTKDPIAVGGTPMICVPGYGPYDQASQKRTPHFAQITATGTDGPATNGTSSGRTIVTVYNFQTDDTNIPGGVIRVYPDSSGNQWCMDAGSATPAVNTQIVLQACSTASPPLAQQVFSYRTDLSIQLVSSVTAANPAGLCVDSASAPHAVGVNMVLKTCSIADPTRCTDITRCSPWNQQWSIDDNAHLQGAKQDQSGLDNYCIDAASQAANIPLTLQTCAGSTQDTRQTWVPSPTTGAGMAGPTYGQLVNYGQFATCIDVTNQNPDSSYLILYSCKQNPNPTAVTFNQVFFPNPALANDATATPSWTELVTTCHQASYCAGSPYPDGTRFCLYSPATAGSYVTVKSGAACPTTAPAVGNPALWQVYRVKSADGTTDLSYGNKYVIKNYNGLCLAPGPTNDLFIGQYLKVIVTTCDGSTGQKWNANPSLDSAKLTYTHEAGS